MSPVSLDAKLAKAAAAAQLSSGWKLAFYVVGGSARYLLNLEISSFSLLLISFANTALSATEAAALRPAGTSAAAAVKYTFFPMKKIHVIERRAHLFAPMTKTSN